MKSRDLLSILLHRPGALCRALVEVMMGKALDAVTARDAKGFFEHRRYRSLG